MVHFCEFSHDVDLPLVLRDLLQHLLFHELDGDDPVFTEMIAFKDDSIVALAKRFGPIDIEIVGDFLHSLHCF